jgi:hypothetical protein
MEEMPCEICAGPYAQKVLKMSHACENETDKEKKLHSKLLLRNQPEWAGCVVVLARIASRRSRAGGHDAWTPTCLSPCGCASVMSSAPARPPRPLLR